jgi:hypothetical protein
MIPDLTTPIRDRSLATSGGLAHSPVQAHAEWVRHGGAGTRPRFESPGPDWLTLRLGATFHREDEPGQGREMNAALITALAALAGSAIGALASFGTTWLTQHHQDRVQRRAQEIARREKLFASFIEQASKLYVHALTHDAPDLSMLVPLYSLKSQLGLFASKATIERADEVLWLIIDIHYQPNTDLQSRETVRSGAFDILQAFTQACREELDQQ